MEWVRTGVGVIFNPYQYEGCKHEFEGDFAWTIQKRGKTLEDVLKKKDILIFRDGTSYEYNGEKRESWMYKMITKVITHDTGEPVEQEIKFK